MKKFLKRYWAIILLVLILVVISILSFVPNKYLLSNDNYSPELNPLLTIVRSLISPAWRSYRVLGFASDSEQADIFRTGLMGLLNLIVGKNATGQIYYLICLFVGSLSIALLTKEILLLSKLKKYSNLGFLLTGIFYISTLWTVWTFYQSMAPYITNFGFLPLLLLCLFKYLENSSSKNALIFFCSCILWTATSVIATLFIVDSIFIFGFIIFWSIYWGKTLKIAGKKALRALGIFISTQLFWILPFIYYTYSTSSDVVSSYVNRSITTSVIDLETQMQTAINTARLYSRILTDSNGSGLLFPVADDFLNYDFYKVVGMIPMVLSLIGTVFALFKKNWKMVIFFLAVFACWFLIKVTNPPLGSVFSFLQANVPLFKQVLRWPSSKLSEVYLIGLSVCSTLGFVYLSDFLISFTKRKWVKKIAICVMSLFIIAPLFFYMEYAFSGHLFAQNALVSVPQEYFDLENFLQTTDTSGRIYYAPPSNQNYFREYNWGFRGSQFISYVVTNPVMDLSSAVGSSYGEGAMLELFSTFKSGSVEKFETLLNKYDVKYLLVDRSLKTEGYTYDIDWALSESLWKDYKSLWKEGSLELYEVPSGTIANYTEGILTSSASTFVRNSAQNPSAVPFAANAENWNINGNEITSQFTYAGDSSVVKSNLSELDWNQLPSKLVIKDNSLLVTPSYPQIKNSNYYKDPYKSFKNENYDYFVAGNKVFSLDNLKIGLTLEDSYTSINQIIGLKNSDFVNMDLTNTLSKSSGEECGDVSSNAYKVSVSSLGGASGLEISSPAPLSCVYNKIALKKDSTYVVRVNLNWEQDSKTSIPGFCLFSEKNQKCLNSEKYFLTNTLYGEVQYLIPVTVSGDDTITLILYALNLKTDSEANIIFRKASVDINSSFLSMPKLSESNEISDQEFTFKNGNQYTISIPLVFGNDSYIYDAANKPNSIWQPNVNADAYSLLWNNGFENTVNNGYLNFSNNLISTEAQQDYFVFWKGFNSSNIPSSICLAYANSNKCWFQDLLVSDATSSSLQHFMSDTSVSNTLNGIIVNTSYTNKSDNQLQSFVVMKSPTLWSSFKYSSINNEKYSVEEGKNIGSVTSSTYYKFTSNNKIMTRTLLTIPQSKNSGWIAVSTSNSGIHILKNIVTVNGWKQGWDISNLSFDNIYIFYWPNILGYIGYIAIVGELVYLVIKVFKRRIYVRK